MNTIASARPLTFLEVERWSGLIDYIIVYIVMCMYVRVHTSRPDGVPHHTNLHNINPFPECILVDYKN